MNSNVNLNLIDRNYDNRDTEESGVVIGVAGKYIVRRMEKKSGSFTPFG